MEDNIQRLNDHTHNGTNSALLTPVNLSKFTSSIAATDWVSDGGGNYHYQVTVPAGISGATSPFNDVTYYSITTKNSSGDILYPTITRDSSTTFTVAVNDNTLVLTLYYL